MSDEDLGARSTATRLIVPAPMETTTERGIRWYEVEVVLGDDGPATVPNEKTVAHAVMHLPAEREIEMVITDQRAGVTIGVSIEGDASAPILNLSVNGQGSTLTGRTVGTQGTRRLADPASCTVTRRLDLSPDERAVIGEWARLAPSIFTLAEATRQSYGCTACLLIGAGATVSATGCVALAAALHPGVFAACGAALAAGGTLVEHCPGACGHVTETAVHLLAEIGVEV